MTRFEKIILSSIFVLFLSVGFAQAQTMTPGQKDPAGYEIMPPMLTLTGTALINDVSGIESQLRNDLIYDQGYEAHCAQKEWVIAKNIWGDIDDYFNQSSPSIQHYPQAGVPVFSGTDPYNVDFVYAHIPMMRGMESGSSTAKNSSFEGMFGANLISEITDENYLNSSGVAMRLLSSYSQCYFKKSNIDAIGRICSQLQKGTGECYLNKEIEFDDANGVGQTLKYLDLQKKFAKVRPTLDGNDLNSQVCYDLFGGQMTSPPSLGALNANENDPGPAVSEDELEYIRNALDRVNIDLDNLYRLGFLVLVPTQDPKDDDDKFHFLQNDAMLNKKKDAPIVIAFKIPEFGTNKSYFAKNIDSLELTKMVLQTEEENVKDVEDQKATRKHLQDVSSSMPSADEEGKTIKCQELPQCERTKENALSNVLIDLINASSPDCTLEKLTYVINEDQPVDVFSQEDLNWERAGDLYTPANKDLGNIDFLNPNNDWAFANLPGSKAPTFNWRLQVDENPPQIGESVRVRAYLVIPVGENIKDVNKSLGIFWSQNAFEQLIKNNVLYDMEASAGHQVSGAIPKFYTIKGEESQFSAGGDFSYLYSVEENWVTLPNGQIIKETIPNNKTFGLNLADSLQTELLFPDFGLGWMVRQIQTTLRSNFAESYDYVRSCERIEDLFLGRCSGNPKNEEIDSVAVTTDDCPVSLAYDPNIELNKDGFIEEVQMRYGDTIMTEEIFDYIVQKATAAEFNPAIFLALGREETGWGGVGNIKVMGCLDTIDLDINSTPKQIVDHQMDCVMRNYPVDTSCVNFMCKYSDGVAGPCEIKLNPTFAINLPIYYNALTTTSGFDEYNSYILGNHD